MTGSLYGNMSPLTKFMVLAAISTRPLSIWGYSLESQLLSFTYWNLHSHSNKFNIDEGNVLPETVLATEVLPWVSMS